MYIYIIIYIYVYIHTVEHHRRESWHLALAPNCVDASSEASAFTTTAASLAKAAETSSKRSGFPNGQKMKIQWMNHGDFAKPKD